MALPPGSIGSMGCGNPNSEVIYDLDDLVALADVKGHDLIKPEPNVGWLCKAVDHLRPHLLQVRYFVCTAVHSSTKYLYTMYVVKS